jgi:hypothetical protein
VIRYGREVLGLGRIVAIAAPDNQASIKLLHRLGLEFERPIRGPDVDRDTSLFTPRGQPSGTHLAFGSQPGEEQGDERLGEHAKVRPNQ